jgi:microcystin-dependent protein
VAAQKFANNASSLLAATITDIETTIQVDSGFGALFPNPGASEYFVIALENSAGDIEICKVTARATDLFTVVRGWEDTVAQAWTGGVTRVELRNTAGSMRQMIQRSGDTMEGNLDMDGFSITNATLSGATIILEGAIIQGAVYQNAAGDTCNQLEIPDGCDPPTVGGSPIMTVANFDPQSVFTAGMIMMWYGDISEIPDGWALCDGNNGRPDLRDRFIVGVGTTYALGDTGGATGFAAGVTGAGGAAGATTEEHVLTLDEIPSHSHRVYSRGSNASSVGSEHYDFVDPAPDDWYVDSQAVGGGLGHTHGIDISDHTHTVAAQSTLPPYYGLWFIIKTDPAGSYGGVGVGGGGDGTMYDMYSEDGCNTHIGGQSTLMDDLAIASAQVQINCCASNVFRLVLTENVTMLAPNNPLSGQVINIILKQGGVGSYTVTWPANFLFPGGTAPTLSTAVGAKDILTAQYDSADDEWMCSPSSNFS